MEAKLPLWDNGLWAESRVLTAHGLHCKHILRNSGKGLVRSGCLDSSGIGEILGIMDNIHDYLTILGCSEGVRERHGGQDVG